MCNNKKFCPQTSMYTNSFVCSVAQIICSISLKSFMQDLRVIKAWNTRIWTFYYLFLSYADDKYTHRATDKKAILDSGDFKICKSRKNLNFKNSTPKQYFLYHINVRESKNSNEKLIEFRIIFPPLCYFCSLFWYISGVSWIRKRMKFVDILAFIMQNRMMLPFFL